MSSRRSAFLSAGEPPLLSTERLAFECEPIAVGDNLKNEINNRGPRCFTVLSKILVVELNRSM
jgi:hypothetical protein